MRIDQSRQRRQRDVPKQRDVPQARSNRIGRKRENRRRDALARRRRYPPKTACSARSVCSTDAAFLESSVATAAARLRRLAGFPAAAWENSQHSGTRAQQLQDIYTALVESADHEPLVHLLGEFLEQRKRICAHTAAVLMG